MHRRPTAHWRQSFLMALFAFFVWSPAAAATPQRQPNIILVLADDLGRGDLGVYGAKALRTPHLDRMAREGARLTSFFASASVCTPSRAGLLTGRHPIRAGLANGVIYPHSTNGLPAQVTTLPELLSAAGYRTAMLGKWHLGSTDASWPTRHGFDRFWGVPWSNDMNPLPLYRQSEIIEQPLVQETFAERLVAEARTIIAEPSDKPFFLYVAHIAPHIPLRPGPAFRGKSAAGLYGDFVEEMDWTMGEIVRAVRAAGKGRDTIIIFTSDNGPWFEGDPGGRRDRKGATFEGAYAVPLVAWAPGRIPAGLASDQIASNLDLAPSLALWAGAPALEGLALDGRDIRPLLTQRGAKSPHPHLLFFSNADIAAVRTQDWRLVLRSYYLTHNASLEQFNYRLLFDMKRDPAETYSLADRFPEVVARLQAVVDAARAEFAGLAQAQVDPFNRAKAPVQLPTPAPTERPAP